MQHVVYHVVQRDSSAIKFDRVDIAFILALFYWLDYPPVKNGELQKMPHTKARKFKPYNSSGGRLGTQTC